MEFKQFVFYVFATLLVFGAAMVITLRNPVKSALFLVLTFFSASGLWLLLSAEFLAIVLVLVYVGAVMVLFLFVVMMLDIDLASLRAGFGEYLPIGGIVAVLLVLEMGLIVSSGRFSPEQMPDPATVAADYSNTRALGRLIYTVYAYPFELAALILLVSIIAAIALTMRRRKDTKYIDPATQIDVRRQDRVRVIKMPAEKKI
jgi:NADH-quinone oxidoreductase subunit J